VSRHALDAQRERFEAADQGHVLRFAGELDDARRDRLAADLARVDLDLVAALGRQIATAQSDAAAPRLEPPALLRRAELGAEVHAQGEELLRAGRVGYLIVAGGQASRLGYDGPKGCFPIGPVSGRTLFEMHARRLAAARARYGAEPVWYVMTSPANDAATRSFFEEQGWFGLSPEAVVFFTQAMLPALDLEGRLLLADKDRLFRAPDGHGGTFAALARSGALDHAREHGIETLSYFQVDNPLARPADPVFLGAHARAGACMSSKVVAKRDAGEKVGVLGRIDGRLGCIEYSDLSPELREARDAQGELLYGAGNIAIHLIQREFAEALTAEGLDLPWHLARKAIRALGPDGIPTDVPGVKFETFVFDALGRARESVTLEVERHEEFSPVKNRTGADSPETSQSDQMHLHADWCRGCALPLPAPDAAGRVHVEVDPCLAEDEAQLRAALPLEPRRVAPDRFLYEA